MDEQRLKQALSTIPGFWDHWGFVPWHEGPFSGVVRVQHFVKDGFLGTIADYAAWETVVWECGTEYDRRELWHGVQSRPEIMTQRFLFLLPQPWAERRIRSFWFGFRGYSEFYAYWPGSPSHCKVSDLTDLTNRALNHAANSA